MYNYVMLIGIVEGYHFTSECIIKLRVDRQFGQGSDHFKIRILDHNPETLKEIFHLGDKVTIKGRLVQTNSKLEILGERIFFMKA